MKSAIRPLATLLLSAAASLQMNAATFGDDVAFLKKHLHSMWEIQKQPYAGDAANSYNDGPATPGAKPMGPFYELESSSPAIALAPGGSFTHTHRTMHLQGAERELDPIALRLFGVGLSEIASVLK